MRNTRLTVVMFTGLLSVTGARAFAQIASNSATVTQSEDERLFAADAATYVSGAPYELQWTPVVENDILWSKRVHRAIRVAQEENQPLSQQAGFADLLRKAIESGAVKAYTGERFAQKLTGDEVEARFAAGEFTKFSIKEDWLYLCDGRELVGRIIGIAPVGKIVDANGEAVEQPLFWIYYPELRPFLRNQVVEGTTASVKNLDQWFEGRQFASADVQTISAIAPPRLRK